MYNWLNKKVLQVNIEDHTEVMWKLLIQGDIRLPRYSQWAGSYQERQVMTLLNYLYDVLQTFEALLHYVTH